MSDVGMQPRGNTPRGLNYVKVLKRAKIISRHCEPGDVVMIEESNRKIAPATDGLTEAHAEYLTKLGIVRGHQLQPGDRPFSVRPRSPGEVPQVESATMPQPKIAERAVTGRQKAAI